MNKKKILNFIKKNYKIIKKVNNFIDVAFGSSGGGIRVLMKWENNKWQTLKASQEGWSCEDMKKYNLPAGIFKDYLCYSYKDNLYYEYNETIQKWEPTNKKPY